MTGTDDHLLRRAQIDPDAFEVFYRRHFDQMIRCAARTAGVPVDGWHDTARGRT